MALNPDSTAALLTLGLALTCLGDYQGAVAANQRVIELDPENLRAHVNLGATLGRMGRYQESISVYKQALALDPDSLRAHLGLGAALGQIGDLKGQVREFQAAARLRPDDDNAHGKLGWALYKAGDVSGALTHGAQANWFRLKAHGPAYVQQFAWLWAGVFFLFGLIFSVVFFSARFTPGDGEAVLRSFYLVFHKERPGRFVITDRRLIFVPEWFSRWFGSEEISIERQQIEKLEACSFGRAFGITARLSGGIGYLFRMPGLVFKPLACELNLTLPEKELADAGVRQEPAKPGFALGQRATGDDEEVQDGEIHILVEPQEAVGEAAAAESSAGGDSDTTGG